MSTDGVPKMEVSDSGGEISASVEETNRIRAQLGLKPLADGGSAGPSKEAEAQARGQERQDQMAKEEAEEAMREKLDAARRKRLLHQKLSGASLGEQLAGEEMDSAAAWVAKTRNQEEQRAEKRKELKAQRKAKGALAAQASRYDDEEALGLGFGGEDAGPSSSLAGAVVGHGTDDFQVGESVVLTLADQTVLGEGEGGAYALNEDAEMLENVNMAEQAKRDKVKAEARGDNYKYNPYEGTGGSGVLGKYDDAPARQTITLDASGSVDEAKQKKLAAIRARLAATQAGAGGTAYDLAGAAQPTARTIADGDDYQSREEVREEALAFRKSTKADKGDAGGEGGGEKKKKKMRKKVKSDGLDLEAMAAAEAERAASAAGGGGDHGSAAERRVRLDEKEAANLEAASHRRDRFDRALATADAKSKAMEFEGMEEEAEVDAEVDAELYASLARARRLASAANAAGADDRAAQRVADTIARTAEVRAANGGPDGADGPEGGVELDSLEFSETGEFCKAVRAKDDVDAGVELPSHRLKESLRQKEEGTATSMAALGRGGGGSSGVVKTEDRVKVEDGGDDDDGILHANALPRGDDDDEGDDDEEDDEEKDGLEGLREKKASGGLGAVLDIARNRGMLQSADEKAGRMFDQKGAGLHTYEEEGAGHGGSAPGGKEPTFVLEHYDECVPPPMPTLSLLCPAHAPTSFAPSLASCFHAPSRRCPSLDTYRVSFG